MAALDNALTDPAMQRLFASDPVAWAAHTYLGVEDMGLKSPTGQFWHRYIDDGYGETPDGRGFGGNDGLGRPWPIFAGEGGEYELAASELSGDVAAGRAAAMKLLSAVANTANDGRSCSLSRYGTTTRRPAPTAACPEPAPRNLLGWTHAQFIRLAWSIDPGHPVERPNLVSCHYGGPCSNSAPHRSSPT